MLLTVFPSSLQIVPPYHPEQSIPTDEWLRRISDQQRREGKVFADEVEFFAGL
jgi:hypothetical protein